MCSESEVKNVIHNGEYASCFYFTLAVAAELKSCGWKTLLKKNQKQKQKTAKLYVFEWNTEFLG